MFNMSKIEITEQHTVTGNKNIFLKPEDQSTIVRVSVDKYNKTNNSSNPFYNFCRKVFLPQGYPKTVSEDYFQYQFYDTIQAFASRITGTIATKAILKGVGVGNAEATAVSAAITWIFKDGIGMLGGILFASWKGSEFDANCKGWRLFADFLNDAAMTLELFLPFLFILGDNNSVLVVTLLCVTTCMKAAVGVAGSATRAAVTQHQAVIGNAADVAAKDGSQETAVNLVASFAGIAILSLIHDNRFEWSIFFLFVLLHLFANYLAVTSLVFRTLNEVRFNIILRSYCRFDNVPEPVAVNRSEPVIIGIKHKHSAKILCNFKFSFGTSIHKMTTLYKWEDLQRILEIYKNKSYIIIPNINAYQINVNFYSGETANDIITAYFHAVILALAYNIKNNEKLEFLMKKTAQNSCLLTRLRGKLAGTIENDTLKLLDVVNKFVESEISTFKYELEKKGWKTNLHSICIDDWRIGSVQL